MWPVTLEEMLCHCGLHLVPTGLGWLEKPANIPAETSVHFREILELKIILNMNFKKVTLRYSNASGWKMNFHLQLDGNFIFSSCARYSTMIFFTSISPFYIFHLYLEASSINPWILWPFHPHLSLLAQAAVPGSSLPSSQSQKSSFTAEAGSWVDLGGISWKFPT